jgi:chorismate synthase
MPSNRLSQFYGISTFGESHGSAVGILFDSPIPDQTLPLEEIKAAFRRRGPKGKFSTSRIEPDEIEVLSGLFEGKTTGAPLCIVIRNKKARELDYAKLKKLIRPGYADYSWLKKYHIFDYRGGGRASGRETVARVLAAELLKHMIPELKINSYIVQIGSMKAEMLDEKPKNPYYWPDPNSLPALEKYLKQILENGDSIGGVIRIKAGNVPPGLGDPIYEKLSANIAKAMFSIPSVRGILFGDGMLLAERPGSFCNDQYSEAKLSSNHHGGILGGVSTGAELSFDLVLRPVSSISKAQNTIDLWGNPARIEIAGRHDTCHLPRVIPVAEAMLIIALTDALQYQRLIQRKQNLEGYREMLDKLDEDLLLIIKRRREVVKMVKEFKLNHDLPQKDEKREKELLERLRKLAEEWDLDEELVQEIMMLNLRVSAK